MLGSLAFHVIDRAGDRCMSRKHKVTMSGAGRPYEDKGHIRFDGPRKKREGRFSICLFVLACKFVRRRVRCGARIPPVIYINGMPSPTVKNTSPKSQRPLTSLSFVCLRARDRSRCQPWRLCQRATIAASEKVDVIIHYASDNGTHS